MRKTRLVLAVAIMVGSAELSAMTVQECMIEALENAPPETTIGELRSRCKDQAEGEGLAAAEEETQVEQYLRSDEDIGERKYLISVHNQNYILPYTYNDDLNLEPWKEVTTPENVAALKEEEAVFQVSAKLPVWRDVLSQDMDMYFGYTQKSWWQVFTDEADLSAPFRETNYEPELFVRHYGGPAVGDSGRVSAIDFGYVHQSNGRSDIGGQSINRSWDRMMARAVFDWDEFALLARAWWAFDESDGNPNMYKYRGYGDLRAIWAPNKHTFGLMVRPGTEEYGVEASWSWQVTDLLRLYTQYYYGYGESLVDYNAKTSRIGVGIMFNDFLMGYTSISSGF